MLYVRSNVALEEGEAVCEIFLAKRKVFWGFMDLKKKHMTGLIGIVCDMSYNCMG